MSGKMRMVSVATVGVLVGCLFAATPVYSHVGGTVRHLWRDHIKTKVTKLVYTKAQSDALYAGKDSSYTKVESDDLYAAESHSHASTFDTTVVTSMGTTLTTAGTSTGTATCPANTKVVGGGIEFDAYVSSSLTEGPYVTKSRPAATGEAWDAAIYAAPNDDWRSTIFAVCAST